jgi:signal peptidase I
MLGISVTKNKGMILPFGILNVTSGSMDPDISAGDSVILQKVKTSSLKTGDIISFYYGDVIVTHKIIEINNLTITTKGNSASSLTEIISHSKVIGKYSKIKINGFYSFINFVKSFWGFVIFIMLPLVFLFFSETMELIKNIKSKKENSKNDTKI